MKTHNKSLNQISAEGAPPAIWEGLKYQMYLGSNDFVESMRHKLDRSEKEDLSEISRLQRRPMAKSLQWYKDNTADRKQAMALAYASGDYTMKEMSEWFCVHYSTVSRAVKWFETNARLQDPTLIACSHKALVRSYAKSAPPAQL